MALLHARCIINDLFVNFSSIRTFTTCIAKANTNIKKTEGAVLPVIEGFTLFVLLFKKRGGFVWVPVCVGTCIVHVCICIYMCVYIYVCVFLFVRVCMHLHVVHIKTIRIHSSVKLDTATQADVSTKKQKKKTPIRNENGILKTRSPCEKAFSGIRPLKWEGRLHNYAEYTGLDENYPSKSNLSAPKRRGLGMAY